MMSRGEAGWVGAITDYVTMGSGMGTLQWTLGEVSLVTTVTLFSF